ncbi:MAG: hypothetical protein WC782_14795 [Methylococcaceae bacterium]
MRYNEEDGYALKHLFENLFGRSAWVEIKHSTDLRQWKKYSARVLSALEVSAKATIQVADADWFNQFTSIIEFGKDRVNSSKDFEQLFSSLAATLGEISFLQLGMMPRRLTQENKTLRHKINWKLDRYRSVQYVQNTEQLAATHNLSVERDAAKTLRPSP